MVARSEGGPTPDTWESEVEEAREATAALWQEWEPYRFRNSEKGLGMHLQRAEKN